MVNGTDLPAHHRPMPTDAPSAPETSGEPACEADILAELEELFGRARLARMLGGLDEEIVRRFGSPAPERDALGRNAHAVVSVSGTLGFTPLSRACAELERVCLSTDETDGALRHVLEAAGAARRAIPALIASLR